MTLSHAIEQTPNIIENTLSHLNDAIKEKIKQARGIDVFEKIEEALHAKFVEAERKILGEILSQYDIDLPFITIDDKEYRQVTRCHQNYTSAVGQVRIVRSLYRAKNETLSICPLELRAGIVENIWTPTAAKQALLIVTQLTPYDTARIFKELGG